MTTLYEAPLPSLPPDKRGAEGVLHKVIDDVSGGFKLTKQAVRDALKGKFPPEKVEAALKAMSLPEGVEEDKAPSPSQAAALRELKYRSDQSPKLNRADWPADVPAGTRRALVSGGWVEVVSSDGAVNKTKSQGPRGTTVYKESPVNAVYVRVTEKGLKAMGESDTVSLSEGEPTPTYTRDLQDYYDLLVFRSVPKLDAQDQVKEHFKVKRLDVTPTGLISSPEVEDGPPPPPEAPPQPQEGIPAGEQAQDSPMDDPQQQQPQQGQQAQDTLGSGESPDSLAGTPSPV